MYSPLRRARRVSDAACWRYQARQPEAWPEIEDLVRGELLAHERLDGEAARPPLAVLLRSLSSRLLPARLHAALLELWGRRKSRQVRRQVRETAERVLREHARAALPGRARAARAVSADRASGGLREPRGERGTGR